MKINTLIQPPSLAAQLEGKSNKALLLKIKEINKNIAKEKIENSDELKKAQNLIDLLA